MNTETSETVVHVPSLPAVAAEVPKDKFIRKLWYVHNRSSTQNHMRG